MPPIPRIFPQTPRAPTQAPQLAATPDQRGFSIDLSNVMAAQAPALVDGRGFAAGLSGLQSLGRDVQRIGDAGSRLAEQQAIAVNIRKEHDAKLALEQFDGELTAAIQQEPDETKWVGLAEKYATKARTTILDPARNPLSAPAMEAVQDHLTSWTNRRLASVRVESMRTSQTRAGDAISSQVLTALNSEDYATAETLTQQGVAANLLPQTQIPKVQELIARAKEAKAQDAAANREQAELRGVLDLADANPDAAADLIGGEAWRAGKTAGQIAQAESIVNSRAAKQLDTARDVATEFYTRPLEEQTRSGLEKALPRNLRPADKARFLEGFDKVAAERADAAMATPEAVTARFGQLLDAVGQFDLAKLGGPRSDAARAAYTAIVMGTQTLPEGLRGEVTGPLYRKWGQKPPEPSEIVSDSISALTKNAYDDGRFGAWKTIGPDGKEAVNSAARDNAQVKMATVRMQMQTWQASNPEASPEQARQQLSTFIASNASASTAATVLDNAARAAAAKPAPAVAPSAVGAPTPDTWKQIRGRIEQQTAPAPATPSEPAPAPPKSKVTSYGYKADKWADTLSAMGIGSFSGQAAEKAAKLGKDHPMRLKPGDLAVSPDVERQLRRAGVKPADPIEIVFADGTTHRGRWMDRTANDAQARRLKLPPLRGRWDIYSPDGSSPLNDKPVTSFRRLTA
jgi:hypothetical protein